MKLSLILATVGRVEELERFLSALESQNYSDIEVLVVDQNPDERLHDILAGAAAHFRTVHLRSDRGLSRARNAGLPRVTGDIVAFPDDDCWYPADLLRRVAGFFLEKPEYDGLTGRHLLPNGRPSRGWGRRAAGPLTKKTVWTRHVSFTIFLRKRVVDSIGQFDESLGAGTTGGAGEESDYLLSAIEKGFQIYYEPTLVVFHPELGRAESSSLNATTGKNDARARRNAHSFARGVGYVLRKHNYSPFLAWRIITRPLQGFVYSLLTGRPARALIRWNLFTGALAGYRGRPPTDTCAATKPRIGASPPRSDAQVR